MRVTSIVTALVVAASTGVAAQEFTAPPTDRVLGVLPNYSTVERDQAAAPISPRGMFNATARNTFDPAVFSFTALTTMVGQGNSRGYPGRYATAFADNAIGNFLTSTVFPSLLRQDPRYYQRGSGAAARRAWYALSRIAVTRSRDGQSRFNYSEVLGNFTAGAVAAGYYPQTDRSVAAALSRWGTQVAMDALSNELKEFWPDVRQHLRHARR